VLFRGTFEGQIQCRGEQPGFTRLRFRNGPVRVLELGDQRVQGTPPSTNRGVRVVPHDHLRSDR